MSEQVEQTRASSFRHYLGARYEHACAEESESPQGQCRSVCCKAADASARGTASSGGLAGADTSAIERLQDRAQARGRAVQADASSAVVAGTRTAMGPTCFRIIDSFTGLQVCTGSRLHTPYGLRIACRLPPASVFMRGLCSPDRVRVGCALDAVIRPQTLLGPALHGPSIAEQHRYKTAQSLPL